MLRDLIYCPLRRHTCYFHLPKVIHWIAAASIFLQNGRINIQLPQELDTGFPYSPGLAICLTAREIEDVNSSLLLGRGWLPARPWAENAVVLPHVVGCALMSGQDVSSLNQVIAPGLPYFKQGYIDRTMHTATTAQRALHGVLQISRIDGCVVFEEGLSHA
jgi:hypothetical protein